MITFTDQPTHPPYPAYNNSVVRFKGGDMNLIEDLEVNVGPTSNQSMHVYQLHRSIPNGTEVKLSMKATLERDYFAFYSNNANTYVNEMWPANESGGIFTKTFIWNGGSAKNLTVYQQGGDGESSIDWIKLEETDENATPVIPPTIATVTVGGVSFEVYPDSNGEFYFNFKNIIPSLINKSNFADNVPPPNGNWLQTDPDLYHEITADFQVILEEGEPETTSMTLPFLKSVLQKGQRRHVNSDLRPLDHSISQLSQVTYFEGMPFDVSIYSDQEREVTIRNAKTQMEVTRTFDKGVNRMFISSGANKAPESFENDVPLYIGVNDLEFIVDGDVRFTMQVDKKPAECGQLLKWFNPSGGWSYWRFSEIYLETTAARTIERLHGDFDNLDNSRWNVSITGKDVERERLLRSGVMTANELDYVKHIVAAPKVYLFVGDLHQPYDKQDFIEVEVSGRMTTSTKPKMKEIELTMLMPTQYSQTLW